jgi:hypothetical protein
MWLENCDLDDLWAPNIKLKITDRTLKACLATGYQ